MTRTAPAWPGSVWVEAARPRTLAAAVTPVLVGTAAAGRVIPWRLAAALVVALGVQVGANYANDYSDGVRGLDTPARVGPRRAVAAGLVAPARMRRAILAAFGVAAVAGLALAAASGWELVAVGALCFAAAAGYSGGPRPYASAGLGEVFVFVFFGLVATVGSAFVQVEDVPAVAVAAAVPVGWLASAILVANNLRDIDTDGAVGKRTLAVRLGAARTRRLYTGLVLGSFAWTLVVAAAAGSPWPLVALGAAPLAVPVVTLVRSGAAGRDLAPALAGTAGVQLACGVALAVGLWLA